MVKVWERVSILKNNQTYKKWLPYGIILLLVILLEVFVFNFSTWNTMSCEPIVLAVDVETDEAGMYKTDMVPVGQDVKNVNVELTVEHYDRATVRVVLTDAGDYYEYLLPDYVVAPGVEGSGYQNIYPFGEVNTLQVIVCVPQGTQANISSIEANVNRPMDFKVLRVGILFAVLTLGYIIFADRPLMKVSCKKGCKWQIAVSVAVIAMLIVFAGILVKSNPIWLAPSWPHHRQYQELAHSLKEGTVVIDDKPEAALLEKENPYDTSALLAEGISFRMDYAFYNGNYYAYFGIIPELLFFLPYYLVTGQDLQNYMVVYIFYGMMVLGIFGTLWELVHRFGKKVPFVWNLMLAVSVSLLPNYVFILKRPDLYNIPVIAGNAFAFLGTFFWMRALWNEKHRWLWLMLGAVSMACIAGSRPQMLLYTIFIFIALFVPVLWRIIRKKEKEVSFTGKDIIGFVIPFVVIAAVVIWYNVARFGNPLEFGATLSLTSNDMNHRGFNFSRLYRGLYSFLFQPPVVHASYPFLESAQLEGNYMGKNIVEFCFGGIFAIYPLLLSLFYVLLGGYKKYNKEAKTLILLLSVASLGIAGFDINAAGVLQRYMGDIVLGFIIAAVTVLFYEMGSRRENGSYLWIAKGTYLAVVYSWAFSFMVFISSTGGETLEDYNIRLFHWIQTYFKF